MAASRLLLSRKVHGLVNGTHLKRISYSVLVWCTFRFIAVLRVVSGC